MGERTNWRDSDLKHWHEEHGFAYPTDDAAMSERHRKWGPICGCDIDWLYIEYNYGIPIALFDYKYREGLKEVGNETDKRNYNNMALSVLSAPSGPLPFYIPFYIKSPWTFRLFPMNDEANKQAPGKQLLTEREYAEWLHELRKYKINEHLAHKLDNQICRESLHPSLNQLHKRKFNKKRNKSSSVLFDQNPALQQKLPILQQEFEGVAPS